MQTCLTCGQTVATGGVKAHGYRFCNNHCHQQKAGYLASIAAVSPAEAAAEAAAIRNGPCPLCLQRQNLVEQHQSTFVWSAVLYTRSNEESFLACTPCAGRRRASDSLKTFLLGWWGLPLGVFLTPLALLSNLFRGLRDPARKPPSKGLLQLARERVAMRADAPEPLVW